MVYNHLETLNKTLANDRKKKSPSHVISHNVAPVTTPSICPPEVRNLGSISYSVTYEYRTHKI